jgi:carbohydrate kinase (thermoresistant glucokinase family)
MQAASDSPQPPARPGRWVVMGVSGCGKSTIGAALAHAEQVPFIEGDEFHPDANVAKMASGVPLDDTDRAGWLQTLAEQIGNARAGGTGIVVSCSALKRRYRDLLRQADPDLRFIHLHGSRALIEQRLHTRPGHFMPPALLDSQLRDLEPLEADEAGMTLDITLAPWLLVARITASQERGG